MLAVTGVDRVFGTWRALSGVSLTVAAGEAVLLVGRNGAGKTTLLRIIAGFLDPDAGEVTIDGISVARERARAQARLGYLPEHAPAPPELTVYAHLRLRAQQKRVPASAVGAALAAAAIESVAARRIGTLSKGYRQRVGLADALLGEPPLLVLDEPTSGMDPIQTRDLCVHLVAAATRRAVLVSTHAVGDSESLAGRVAVLRDGKLVADATPAGLRAQTQRASLEDAVIHLLETEAAA